VIDSKEISMHQYLDFDALLAPIPGEFPAGVDAQRLPESAAIEDAIRADDVTNTGVWEVKKPKVAEWKKVIAIASTVLAEKSKDLRLVVRLGQALAVQHGCGGATEALALAEALLVQYWEHLYPELDEGDAIYRRAQIELLVTRIASELATIPVAATSGASLSLTDYLESKVVDQLRRSPTRRRSDGSEMTGQQMYDEAISEGKVSGELFAKVLAETPGNHLLTLRASLASCTTAAMSLKKACEEKMYDDPPSFKKLEDALETLTELVGDTIAARGITEEVAPADGTASPGEAGGVPADATRLPGNVGGAVLPNAGSAPATRQQALMVLEQVSQYFKTAEPHSPVHLLLDRAVKWARLPLPDVLRELVEDDGALRHVDKLLGISRPS
jgi:type VI secretion system protein ImpA